MTPHQLPAYRRRLVAIGYDALNSLLWLPSGSDRLRRQFVERVVTPGATVLELGCGTGLVTRHLVAAGAALTAVDNAAPMLAAARRRAPSATFVEGDVVDVGAVGPFDLVVCGFVLHELDPARRAAVLSASAALLVPGGRVGILEWATPSRPLVARLWRSVVRVIEPAVAHDVLDDGVERALDAAGLEIIDQHPLAGGRARVVMAATPNSDPNPELRGRDSNSMFL